MSKKDFDAYYEKICSDYHEMIETIHELEEECNNNMISPEHLEGVKATIEPLKNNYMTLSWVKFLLDKPVKKEKIRPYEKRMQKFIKELDKDRTPDGVHAENQNIISNIK